MGGHRFSEESCFFHWGNFILSNDLGRLGVFGVIHYSEGMIGSLPIVFTSIENLAIVIRFYSFDHYFST